MNKLIVLLLACVTLVSCNKDKSVETEDENVVQEKIVEQYGFVLNNYDVVYDTIRSGEVFSKMLEKYHLGDVRVHDITEKIKDSINFRSLKAGRPYVVLRDKSAPHQASAMIYEEDAINYYVIHLKDSIYATKKQKPITIQKRTMVGEIEGSLFETLQREGVDVSLAQNLAKVFEYSVDFFKIQKGDEFGVVFYEKFIDDTIYGGVDRMEASYFIHKGKKMYAFPFKKDPNGKAIDYYDEEGKALKTMFLKAPLDFFRITSKFSPKRFHPVQKTWKAHKGTDYAAPHGTPIRTTASGVVERTGYTAGNGNYVKVKHNGTYSTQYLHMSKILVKQGQRVSQGEVIGKVGSTGLATGPHVCYRFWKNGVQVDPLNYKGQASEPLEAKHRARFMSEMESMKRELDSVAVAKKSQNNI